MQPVLIGYSLSNWLKVKFSLVWFPGFKIQRCTLELEKDRDCQFCECCSEGHSDEAPYRVEDLGESLEFTCLRCGNTSSVKMAGVET
jgi:hypothetical protein